MKSGEALAIGERTPEAVLDFWLGPLRTAADTSRENWKRGMLRWRMGPFARSAENHSDIRAQRAWCEQIHREGSERFFRNPAWKTPKGWLAKLIVLDQFPRSVYRGTALAYANDEIAASMAVQACETGRDAAEYNVVERLWIYMPLAHAEDLTIQEISMERFARWSVDLIATAPPERRRINQFVSWSIIKGVIEHSEALLLFGRFPHRNAALQRPHRGGEPRYLTDEMRPLWSFTQPPNPEYFALLGALHRTADGLDEHRITREALAGLLRATGLLPEEPDSPMRVFHIDGRDTVPYPVLYRHLLLPEQAQTLDILRRTPLVSDLTTAVKRLFLKNGSSLGEDELTWPPPSARRSVEPAIDIAALNALVRRAAPSGEEVRAVRNIGRPGGEVDGSEPVKGRSPEQAQGLRLAVGNGSGALHRVARAIDEFADRHRFPEHDRFQVQLCIEEILMYIVEFGYDDAATHRIEIDLDMDVEDRRLAVRSVDDGRELDPSSYMFQPGADTIEEENVVAGIGLNLLQTYVDDLGYRRKDGLNYLSFTKKIGG